MSNLTTSSTSSTANTDVKPEPFNPSALSGMQQLVDAHQDTSEYLRFQSHVQIPIIMNPPAFTVPMTDEEKKEVILKLKSEKRMIKMLKDLVEMAELTNISLLEQIEGDRSGWNVGW